MYKNEIIEEDLELYNKIYVPNNLVNENYKYTFNNDTLTIITNQNCESNYNTTNCTCYNLNVKYNLIVKPQNKCNYNPTNNIIEYQYITNNVDYSDRITNYYIKQYGIYFGIIIIVLLVASLFKRNSRNI